MSQSSKKQWFKRKRYGYGWVPVTIEGWLTVLAAVVFIVVCSVVILKDVPENTFTAEVAAFLGIVALTVAVLFYVAKQHGPQPKWRWGTKQTDNPDEDY
ncbi:TPA: hypothetical protein EYO12_01205 [Candidatus Saccharibacteria bacterium]|nr:hypothetical protein [Candidatus Saccharibacteria bacterium]HIO87336.1 hypothetical protein [Candidatus Saccharibacteria bacterium]